MAAMKKKTYRVLAIDDEEEILEGYRLVLAQEASELKLSLELKDLEEELFPDSHQGSDDSKIEFTLETRENGEDGFAVIAQAVLENKPFDVVFIDVRMPPGINGVEAAARIRKIDPDVRIVVVSGYSDFTEYEIRSRIKPRDRIFYVQKPFHSDHIRQLAQSDH